MVRNFQQWAWNIPFLHSTLMRAGAFFLEGEFHCSWNSFQGLCHFRDVFPMSQRWWLFSLGAFDDLSPFQVVNIDGEPPSGVFWSLRSPHHLGGFFWISLRWVLMTTTALPIGNFSAKPLHRVFDLSAGLREEFHVFHLHCELCCGIKHLCYRVHRILICSYKLHLIPVLLDWSPLMWSPILSSLSKIHHSSNEHTASMQLKWWVKYSFLGFVANFRGGIDVHGNKLRR